MVFCPDTVINSLIHANIIYYNCTYFTIRMNRKLTREARPNLDSTLLDSMSAMSDHVCLSVSSRNVAQFDAVLSKSEFLMLTFEMIIKR